MKKIILAVMILFMSSSVYAAEKVVNKTDSEDLYLACKIKNPTHYESLQNSIDFMINLASHQVYRVVKPDGHSMTLVTINSHSIGWVEKATDMHTYGWYLSRYTLELDKTTIKPYREGFPKVTIRFSCLKMRKAL